MLHRIVLLSSALAALCAGASEYTLDFTGASALDAEAPVLRRAEMVADVGTVPAVAVGDTLNLKLFGDVEFAFNIVSAPPAGIAGQSFIAKDANGSASAIVKVTDKTARIFVDDFMNRRQYTVRCKDGKVLVVERDNSQEDGGECGTCGGEIEVPQQIVEETKSTSTKKSRTLLGASGDEFPIATQKSVVDILVAFDQGAVARSAALGYETIEDFADYAVGKMNTVLANSQLDNQFCYRLVGVTEIDNQWTKINNDVIQALRSRAGKLAKIDQLREKYGADTITLLINRTEGTTSGVGFEYSGDAGKTLAYFESMNYACNVCDINTVYSRYTMSHETGHNMGCGHSNRQGDNSGPGRYSYSCGYHFEDQDGVKRYTIMAYDHTSPASGTYSPVPYFSTPEISPTEYGRALGVEGVNDNRQTLQNTHAEIASLRDHVLPYEWDVKFRDANGDEIYDGAYFDGNVTVTLIHDNPAAEIYYTLDGSTPTYASSHGGSGETVHVYLVSGPKTLTACAVVDGKAQSMRSITLKDGFAWSGEEGQNGNGLWIANDSSVKAWNASSSSFVNNYDSVVFPDLAGIESATVTVKGFVSPVASAFLAYDTAYTFKAGDETATISLPDSSFAPAGDLTFEVPVQLAATDFATPASHTVAFNAPFGQTVDADSGYCTNMVVVGNSGTFIVAPGKGKTQIFDRFNNTGNYYSSALFKVGEGTVRFSGSVNGNKGLFGSTQISVGDGGNLVFDVGGGTGIGIASPLTVEKGGRVTFNEMEHLHRTLNLAGGNIYCKRLDWINGPTINATDDSSIEPNGNESDAYIWIRFADATINVEQSKTLTLNVPIEGNGYNTADYGFTKTGAGELLANKPMTHTGSTIINEGTVAIGYSSSTAVGAGWTVATGARLKVKEGKLLTVPSLTLESGAKIEVGAAETAPLVVTDEVSLNGVLFELEGVEEFEAGDVYPLVKSATSISGVTGAKTTSLPTLSNDLKWKLEEEDGTLYAKVEEKPVAADAVSFTSNSKELAFDVPYDATIGEHGGAVIDASPIVVDGLSSKAITISLDVVVPNDYPNAKSTLCSWKVGDFVIYCVHDTNGNLDCYWAKSSKTGETEYHVDNSTNTVQLTSGPHTIQIGYYSSAAPWRGTLIYVDVEPAYYAPGLTWSSHSATQIAIGKAIDYTDCIYNGLEITGVAVVDALSTEPLPRMTSSGGDITYNYYVATNSPPRVFGLTSNGAFTIDEAAVDAAFSSAYEDVSVSMVAKFPENATGSLIGLFLNPSSGLQAEYRGNGSFIIRNNGYSENSYPATVINAANEDFSVPHVYTLTYSSEDGAKFYQDGVELLRAENGYKGNNYKVYGDIVLGCGPWSKWVSNYNDNPMPMQDLSVYASHIALGTSDRTESEGPVMRAMGTLPIVDVLVAYDNGAQAYVANKGVTLEEFAETQIGKMNEVLITNKLNNCYSYRLAGVCKVAATYGKIDDVTSKLVSGEGALVSLRAARELYGADTVTLLVNTSGATLGDSIPLSSPTDVANQHECAFSVCSIRAVDTGKQHTMIHENAHNMGCGHADAQAPRINSPFEYGRGYYFQDGEASLHTIMAYGGDNDASWYFSTSSSRFGLTLGDATHDNARVLRETCSEVAKWRDGSAISLEGVEIPGVALETSARFPWYVDNEGLVRSYNRTEYDGNQCTTPLKATIEGPKRLSFSHKSYFGGESVAGSNYSHFDVLLDDAPILTQTECTNEWTEAYVDVPEGTHEVTFVFSQRFAMNNSSDYKDGDPDADDAVWLKDLALNVIPHSSTSDDVSWTFPADAVSTANELDGIEIKNAGIVETLGFSTNAVVLSVLAELPDEVCGEIAGCYIYRASNNENFHAFAYSNGDGTFSLGYADANGQNTLNKATSEVVKDWNGLHVWTFAFGAQTGAKLYCDGVEIASTEDIKWSNTSVTGDVTFGDDPRGGMAIKGMKIYAIDSDFGVGENIFNKVYDSVDFTLGSYECLDEYVNDPFALQLELLAVYKDVGYISSRNSPATECVLRISEIMPKPTDDLEPGLREGMDVNGLESGWVEVENTSAKWVDLKDYKFTRTNRGKKSNQADYGNFPSRLIPPYGRAIFYTSERYSNSKSKEDSAFAEGTFDGKPMIFEDYGNILVWGDKVNPKKSPFVRLYYAPNDTIESVVDTVVIPSDLPEGWSIIVGQAEEGEGTRRWMCPTPTRNAKNSDTDGLKRIGPNVGPLYEKKGQKKTDLANEFATNEVIRIAAPLAVPGKDYIITLPINPVMNPAGVLTTKETPTPREADQITSLKLVYRKDLNDSTLVTNTIDKTTKTVDANWGDLYTATIPAGYFPEAGHLMQWKVLITDGEGVEWMSPSFNNPDDGYEWYGTIVEPGELNSSTLPTWHMFATGDHLTQMDYDKDDSKYTLENGARIAIYDSSTSNYYDYVRIDLRGNTSKDFKKKSHGLRFAKAHPLTMTDIVTGEQIKEIRKTSLISEYADPSYMRQMMAFWLWRKMGNLVPFDFPVRCNLNGEFYQLAFNSERFTDELIEDVYGLDKFGYGYKNVGWLESDSSTTAGGIEKKTPDDENEKDLRVLSSELTNHLKNLHDDDLTKFVVEKFDLPAWLNYLASARITQEMDDVWANLCIYYDNPDMNEGARGTDTWMPLGYDFNLSFGQWYYNDSNNLVSRFGLMSNQDWYKSHPLYGGRTIRAYRCEDHYSANYNPMNGNYGFEAVLQSSKFRRLYLRRLRTLMDQELKEPGTPESEVPFMAKMREMADLMRADSALDLATWPDDNSDKAIDIWLPGKRPGDMDAGITEIWNDYVVPRREHLYVTHSVTNTAKAIGYGSNLNAGIPEAQSPISVLAQNFVLAKLSDCVVISNLNNEVVDMSGWTLKFGVEWTLPAGTVCDSNDCIYVVADRRSYIEAHNAELTDQVIVGNATFSDWSAVYFDAADGTVLRGVSSDDSVVTFEAKDQKAADKLVAELSPALTEEDVTAGLQAKYLKVVAEPTSKKNEFVVVVAVNPDKVNAPVIAEPAAESEPVEIEEDDKGETTVSVSISNAVKGLWYGYEVSDELGESAAFANDVDSFERATGSAHTITGSPRTEPSGFFRVKVLPAKPKSSN